MGRHSTAPEVQAISDGFQDLGGYHITRVVDPDDEFARTEWLAWDRSGAEEYVWSDVLSDRTLQFSSRGDAERLCRAYRLGWEDASDRVRVPPLGS